MEKIPRVDRRINMGKVAEVVAENPNLPMRDIMYKTWLSLWTVHNTTKELEKMWTKDETIAFIVGKSKERLKKVQAYFDRYLDESLSKEKLGNDETKIITNIVKDDLARITVLWGTITDEEGGLKQIESMKDEDLHTYILSLTQK